MSLYARTFSWDLPPGCTLADLDPLPGPECPICEGWGCLSDEDGRVGCPSCHGTGEHRHRDECPACNGLGTDPVEPGEPCSRCLGECYL